MFLLIIVFFVIFGAILVSLIEMDLFNNSIFFIVCITAIIAISFIGCPCLIISISKISNTKDVKVLETQCLYNLQNSSFLVNDINVKAVVRSTDKNIIIDLPNAYQSTNASTLYKDYVDKVAEYNIKLAKMKVEADSGFLGVIVYGIYPKLPETLKPILINNK